MINYRLFLLLTIMLFMSVQAEAGFFSDSWNKLTGGGVGNFLFSGGTSGPILSSLEPTIDRYEQANTNSINLLDDKLKSRVTQFGSTISANEDQLDDIIKSSVSLMDVDVQHNIQLLDESVRNNIGGLGSQLSDVSFTFSNALWKVFKAVLLIIAILIFLRIIEKFYTAYDFAKDSVKKTEIFKKYIIPILISFLGIVIIYIISPNIFSKYVDSSFKKQINDLQDNLVDEDQSMNYADAFYTASKLRLLDNTDNSHYYYQKKYEILKDFLYRPKYALFDPSYISILASKISSLEKLEEKAGIIDPDFSILMAIYYYNCMPNQYGNLAAAYLSNKAILEDADLHKDGSASSPLMPIAHNFLTNYNFHPFDSYEAAKNFIKNIFNGVMPNPTFSKEKFTFSHISQLYQIITFDSTLRNTLEEDQIMLLKFLDLKDQAKKSEIGIKFRVRWDTLQDKLNSKSEILFSSAMLKFDDSYIGYVDSTLKTLPGYSRTPKFQKEVGDASAHMNSVLAANSELPDYNSLSDDRKLLLDNFINQFSTESKSPLIKSETANYNKRKLALNSFITQYLNYKAQAANHLPIDAAYTLYTNLATAASNINFYYYTSNINKSFGLCKLQEFEQSYGIDKIIALKGPEYLKTKKAITDQYLNSQVDML